jgi:hypothetical protein
MATPICEPVKDKKGMFRLVVDHLREACFCNTTGPLPDFLTLVSINDEDRGAIIAADVLPQAEEALPIDPGKHLGELPQWCEDLEAEIAENADRLIQAIIRQDASLQEELDDLASCMKEKWLRATEEQKSAWREHKRQTFRKSGLDTRLSDIICSFESSWIPQSHFSCPVCWEQGATARFSTIDWAVANWKGVASHWHG